MAGVRSNGANCCIVGCHTSSGKCRGLSFISLPKAGVSEKQNKWRAELIHAINRCDESFNPDRAKVCSRHFEEGAVKYGPSGKCSGLVFGSMPTRWMPSKSIETSKTTRPEPTPREPPVIPQRVFYRNFNDIRKDLHNLPTEWIIKLNKEHILQVGVSSESDHQWKVIVSLRAENNMEAEVKVLGIPAPHLTTDLETKKLKTFLQELQTMSVCSGVTTSTLQKYADQPDGKTNYFRHIQYQAVNGQVCSTSTVRSISCQLLLPAGGNACCKACQQTQNALLAKEKRHVARIEQPLKPHDPLHSLKAEHLKEAFKKLRQDNTALEKEIEKIRNLLKEHSIQISPDLHDSLTGIDMSGLKDTLKGREKEYNLVELFWAEQKKAFQTKEHGMRWHPMMIRLAILLHSKSKAVYDTLRKTGILKLPGVSSLQQYTSAIHPHEGFHPDVIQEIRYFTQKLPENQRYVVLLHDEMSVKSDLVFDPTSGQLVGFVNNISKWRFDIQAKLASHALVFYVVGVNSSLKTSLAFFGTCTAAADELYPLFWQAVGCLEDCGLKVIASTSDKAPGNQRLYQMHGQEGEICYKTLNIYAPDRSVYFISDAPHLIKTVRNNIASSRMGGGTRLLWKDNQYILWQHIADLYYKDVQLGLRQTPLTADHISLTPHSLMNVRLAAQVMSRTVGEVLRSKGGADRQETARFILLMDRFFDCLNSRNLVEAKQKRNKDLLPYTDVNDVRFVFLEREFLLYLEDWRTAVQQRAGFTAAEKQKMFLSHQTYKGLVMTVKAFVEVTRYLLTHGVEFVFSNKFCQDPIEEHFGRHRAMGRTAENPNLYQFGHQENSIRMQRQVALAVTPKGNVRTNQQQTAITITTSPLKKKSRTGD